MKVTLRGGYGYEVVGKITEIVMDKSSDPISMMGGLDYYPVASGYIGKEGLMKISLNIKDTMKKFTRECKFLSTDKGWNFKSIVNLSKLNYMSNQHAAFKDKTTDGRNIKAGLDYDIKPNYEVAQLNHYYTKSFKDWLNRFERGDVNTDHRKFDGFFELNEDFLPVKELLTNYYVNIDIKWEDLVCMVNELI